MNAEKLPQDLGASPPAWPRSRAPTRRRRRVSPPAATRSTTPTWTGARPCRYCGTGCGVEVGVKDGRVVAVRGDEEEPGQPGPAVREGLPPARHAVRRGPAEVPDAARRRRLEAHLLGRGARPDRSRSTRRRSTKDHGPSRWRSTAPGSGRCSTATPPRSGSGRHAQQQRRAQRAPVHGVSAVMGFMTQFQSDEPMGCYEDFEAGDDFVLWGNNMAEMHPVLFSRILEPTSARTRASGSSTSARGARRPPTTPTCTWSS